MFNKQYLSQLKMNIALRMDRLSRIIRIITSESINHPPHNNHPHRFSLPLSLAYYKSNIKKQSSGEEHLGTQAHVFKRSLYELQREQKRDMKDIKSIVSAFAQEYQQESQSDLEVIEEEYIVLQGSTPITKSSGGQELKNRKEMKKGLSTLQDVMGNYSEKEAQIKKYKFQEVSEQVGKENAITFLQHLDHTLSKPQILQLIKMIEVFSRSRRGKDMQHKTSSKGKLKRTKSIMQKTEDAIFLDEVKSQMSFCMNYFRYLDTNSEYIESMVELLTKSHLEHITELNYHRQTLSDINITTNRVSYIIQAPDFISEFRAPSNNIDRQIKLNSLQPADKKKSHEQKPNKSHNALLQAFKLKDNAKMQKINLKGSPGVAGKENQREETSGLIFSQDQPVIYQKKQSVLSDKLQLQNRKFIYCFELPYNLKQEEAEQFIKYLRQSKEVSIVSFYLFSYKEFINKNYEFHIIYKIPDDIQDNSNNKITKQRTSLPLQSFINKTNTHDKMSESLLLKIKKENYSKFNKSFIVMKLQEQSDKHKIFSKTSRLFGINYKNLKNIKFEDGSGKNMVVLKGIPWGLSSKQLQSQINKTLKRKDLQVTINVNGSLTNKLVYLKFDYLSEALQAIKRLNNMKIENVVIKAYLTYGHCKIFNQRYQDNLGDSHNELKKRIGQSRAEYEKYYELFDKK